MSTRRGFMKIAGAGVAAAGVGGIASGVPTPVFVGGSASAVSGAVGAADGDASADADPGTDADAVVAYVQNSRTGEVAVMAGGREVTVIDHQLVARLTNALREGDTAAAD
jgi:hypothetical protein